MFIAKISFIFFCFKLYSRHNTIAPKLNGGEKKNAVADALPWEFLGYFCFLRFSFRFLHFSGWTHGLRTPREEIAFTARPKIHSHFQIFRYGRSIFCLPHWPKFSYFFDLCLHWVSLVCGASKTYLIHTLNE